MPKFPYLHFSCRNQTPENGGATWSIWHHRGPGNAEWVGVLHKTRGGMWRFDMNTPDGRHVIDTAEHFAAAKAKARACFY